MIGRNDPCWCKSGQKYKKCHGQIAAIGKNTREIYLRQYGIILKTPEMVAGIRAMCILSATILDEVCSRVKPGLTTDTINTWVDQMTRDAGANPSPLNYRGFPKSVCTSINQVVCHGIPGKTILRDGDILNIDVTCDKNGYFGDTSKTVYVGTPSPDARRVTETARECLELAIKTVRPGSLLSEIGAVIEEHAHRNGCSVVRDFVGHGIGAKFHEKPEVFHFKNDQEIPLVENMVFTIEPMINLGDWRIKILADKWTAVTADNSLSAQFEHTILVTRTGAEILTRVN